MAHGHLLLLVLALIGLECHVTFEHSSGSDDESSLSITIQSPFQGSSWMPLLPVKIVVMGGSDTPYDVCFEGSDVQDRVLPNYLHPQCLPLIGTSIPQNLSTIVQVPAPRDWLEGNTEGAVARVSAWLQMSKDSARHDQIVNAERVEFVSVSLGPPRLAYLSLHGENTHDSRNEKKGCFATSSGSTRCSAASDPKWNADAAFHRGHREVDPGTQCSLQQGVVDCVERGSEGFQLLQILSPAAGQPWAPEVAISVALDVSIDNSEGAALIRSDPGSFELCYHGGHHSQLRPTCVNLLQFASAPMGATTLPNVLIGSYGLETLSQGITASNGTDARNSMSGDENCCFIEAWLVKKSNIAQGDISDPTESRRSADLANGRATDLSFVGTVVGRTRVQLLPPSHLPARPSSFSSSQPSSSPSAPVSASLRSAVTIIVQGPAHLRSIEAVLTSYSRAAATVIVSCWASAEDLVGREKEKTKNEASGEATSSMVALKRLDDALRPPIKNVKVYRNRGGMHSAETGGIDVWETIYRTSFSDSDNKGGDISVTNVVVLKQKLPKSDPESGFALTSALYQFTSTLLAFERVATPYVLKTRSDEAYLNPVALMQAVVDHPSQLTCGAVMLAAVGVSDHVFGGATPLMTRTVQRIVGLLNVQQTSSGDHDDGESAAAAAAAGEIGGDGGADVFSVEDESPPAVFVQEDLVFPGPEPITPESLLLRAFIACSPEGAYARGVATAAGHVLALPARPPLVCEADAWEADERHREIRQRNKGGVAAEGEAESGNGKSLKRRAFCGAGDGHRRYCTEERGGGGIGGGAFGKLSRHFVHVVNRRDLRPYAVTANHLFGPVFDARDHPDNSNSKCHEDSKKKLSARQPVFLQTVTDTNADELSRPGHLAPLPCAESKQERVEHAVMFRYEDATDLWFGPSKRDVAARRFFPTLFGVSVASKVALLKEWTERADYEERNDLGPGDKDDDLDEYDFDRGVGVFLAPLAARIAVALFEAGGIHAKKAKIFYEYALHLEHCGKFQHHQQRCKQQNQRQQSPKYEVRSCYVTAWEAKKFEKYSSKPQLYNASSGINNSEALQSQFKCSTTGNNLTGASLEFWGDVLRHARNHDNIPDDSKRGDRWNFESGNEKKHPEWRGWCQLGMAGLV